MEFGEAGRDDFIRAAAFFGIRHLAGDDGFDLVARQTAFQDAGELDIARGGDGDDGVEAVFRPVSNSSGMSSRTARRLARKAAARNFASSW